MKNPLIIVLVLSALLRNCSCQFTCDPFIDCQNAEAGDFVPDPEDCTKYYICVTEPPGNIVPSAVPFQCPSGTYFDQNTTECITESETCQNLCKPELNEFSCDPVKDCQTAEVGDLVPDPNDCEKYYMCVLIPPDNHVGPSAAAFKCPDGMYFDQETASCIIKSTPCQNLCVPEFIQCVTQCPPLFESVVAVANKTDCSYFTICRNGTQSLARCPEDSPFFNGSECVSDVTQCCNFCNPYCSQIGFQIQDPCDCSSFFVCTDVGLVTNDTVSNPCSPGQYFLEEEGTCTEGTCNNICPTCENTSSTPTAETEAPTTTEFVCTAYCTVLGTQIQNPCSCTSFYICSDLGPVPDGAASFQCPPGLYFDEDAEQCSDGSCNNTCQYCGETDTTVPGATSEFLCTAYCTVLGTQIQNPCSCTSFYICSDLEPVPDGAASFQCPPGLYFAEDADQCIEGSCKNKCHSCGSNL